MALGVEENFARRIGASGKGPWTMSGYLGDILTPRYFDSLNLVRLAATA